MIKMAYLEMCTRTLHASTSVEHATQSRVKVAIHVFALLWVIVMV